METNKSVSVSTRLSKEVKDRLDIIAEKDNRSISQIIDLALKDYLTKAEKRILDENKTIDRNVAFGKILGVMQKAEEELHPNAKTSGTASPLYYKFAKNNRFVLHPLTVLSKYDSELSQAYADRGKSYDKWKTDVMNIISKMSQTDMNDNELSPSYLFGYYSNWQGDKTE